MLYRRNYGLTFAEIMVAMCLAGLLLVTFLTVLANALEGIRTSKNISIATSLAYKHLEAYKSNFALIYNPGIIGIPDVKNSDAPKAVDKEANIDGAIFTPALTVKPLTMYGSSADIKQILDVTITVYWYEGTVKKKIMINSFVANRTYIPSEVNIY